MLKTVSLDADGVLIGFLQGVQRLVYQAGSQQDILNRPGWTPWKKIGLDNKQQSWVESRIGAPGFCSSLPVLPGAKETVQVLQDLAEVFVITTPWKKCPTWTLERTLWLQDTLNIPAENIVHTMNKTYWWSDFFVDDKPSNVRLWRAKWGTGGYLWNTPQNQEATDLPRLHSWDALIALVRGPQ